MKNTLNVYDENVVCEVCKKGPVEFVHWGPLSKGKFKRFCKKCFKESCGKEDKTKKIEAIVPLNKEKSKIK